MGGEILEYEAKAILNEGKKQGWILGRESGLAVGLSTGRTTTYLELVKEGILNIKEAAMRIPMDERELQNLLNK